MKVRVPVLRETWDRVEKLPPMIAAAARTARRLGTDLSPDDLFVMGTFRETDDRVGYEICRRAFLENRVGMVIDLSARITSAAGVDWAAVVEIAASTSPAAKLPAGARRLVDVNLDEELVQQAHEEASRLMGREAVTWAQYRAASREDAPKLAEFVRAALAAGDEKFRTWRMALEAWDGSTELPAWPDLGALKPPTVGKGITARWTAEKILGAWTDVWAAEFAPPTAAIMKDSMTVLVDGVAERWRSLYWRGSGRAGGIAPWAPAQEAWIRKKIRAERKSLLY